MSDFKRFSSFSLLIIILLALPNCAKKEEGILKDSKLKFEDYKDKVAKSFEKKDKSLAVVYLEKMISHYPESPNIERYRLALSDLYYEEGLRRSDDEYLTRAEKNYKRFYKLNPSDPKTEYASYQRILSKFKQEHKVECDCTGYEKIIKLCKKHLENQLFKGGKFEKDVRDIKYTCESLLIDKEEYVFKNALRADQLETAKSRLKYLEDTYLPTNPELAPRIAYLHCKLALKLKDKVAADNKLKYLQENHKDSEFTVMAVNLLTRKDIESRFFL